MRDRVKAESGWDRGWGPFTGRQLTTIIVVVAVMMMLPVGAWAVSGSNAFITDATSGKHAVVDVNGQLHVSAASPQTFYQKNTFSVGSTSVAIGKPPTGKALVITSIAIDTWNAASTGSGEYIALQMSTTNNSCSSVSSNWTYGLNPGGVGSTVLPFQPGIVVPGNRSLCASSGDAVNLGFDVYVFGYLIPAAGAPAGHAVIGSQGVRVQQR